MALKVSHLLFTLLWLSLLFLLFHHFHNAMPFFMNHNNQHIGTTTYPSSSLISRDQVSINRKVLTSKFDFAPFQKRHHRHQKNHMGGSSDERAKSEIDPRYGVEKRLVPTGPNPLHHR
ncbi:CLAVATA3/ESR (CLE)-related protein 12 [Punica granatum]|uniref:CLAVATA3/ESR (CLE)-related protein 12 n=1 Tax=Punica granatum TaxID=22663 RepID=A0A6P8E623_PUNGR|nr:CLAVATA3/ESR (CLE)-related protein 12 [Punica granatum]